MQAASASAQAASGFQWAIYLALGTVFSIIGFLGWRVARAVRRAEAAEDASR